MPDLPPPPATSPASTVTLHHGGAMPWLGLGVWQAGDDRETERAVRAALDCGYRSIDTAKIYGNERGVGRAVRDSGVPREQVFITTKVWNDDVRAGRVAAAFDHSLRLLGLDYLDLYLVHWPIAGKVASTWRAHRAYRPAAETAAVLPSLSVFSLVLLPSG